MITPQNISWKEGHDRELLEEYQQLHPKAQIIAEDMGAHFKSGGYKFIITDIISNAAEDKKLGRVSSSHREGRAFDFRIHGIPKEFLDAFEKTFEHRYKQIAAVSQSTGQVNLIQYHDNGNGNHGHVQIRRGL